MASAVLTHREGVGLAFQAWVQAVMSSTSALTVAWDERRSFLAVSSPNQRSTRLSHDEPVGVSAPRRAYG